MRGASVVGSSAGCAQKASRTTRMVGSVFARVRVVVAALALMAHVVPAMAEPARLVIAPPGWRADPDQAGALAQRFAATTQFGGLPAEIDAEAYVAERPGVALFATRATATLSDPADEVQRGRAARAALDALRASSQRAALTGGAAQEQSWHEQGDRESQQITATLTWQDPASHTSEEARLVIASDGKRIVAVTGACVIAEGAGPRLVASCRSSLALLAAGIARAQRVPIALAAATDASSGGTATAGNGASSGNAPPGKGALPQGAQSTMSAAGDASHNDERVRLPPMTIPPDARSNDRRTAYLGAGVVVLAVMFWWNRRRRDRFEREDRRPPARVAARKDDDADDDADDLHAAAHSDKPAAPDPRDRPQRPHRKARPDRRDP